MIAASYGHVQALSDVSLEVKEKGTVTLIGSNGAGKSTLLKVISGLLKPRPGKGRILRRADRRPPARTGSSQGESPIAPKAGGSFRS